MEAISVKKIYQYPIEDNIIIEDMELYIQREK